MSLNDHKQILYAFPEETSTNTGCERANVCSFSKNDKLFQALNYLKMIENNLLAIDIRNGITENDRNIIEDKLEELITFWKTSKICGNISRIQRYPQPIQSTMVSIWISSKAESHPVLRQYKVLA